jgi:hypothetical protein
MKTQSTTAEVEAKASTNPEGPKHHGRMQALGKTGNFLVRQGDFFAVNTVEVVRNIRGRLDSGGKPKNLRAKKEKSPQMQG